MSKQVPPEFGFPGVEENSLHFTRYWKKWLIDLTANLNAKADPTTGISGTIATAKLTPGGANGSLTFTNGILTAHVDAT